MMIGNPVAGLGDSGQFRGSQFVKEPDPFYSILNSLASVFSGTHAPKTNNPSHGSLIMAETLGSLCDKITIVKLKQWHSDSPEKLQSLGDQQRQLEEEIDQFVTGAIEGSIPRERLTFAANKVYKKNSNPVSEIRGSVGEVFSHLAEVNCKLWHEVEKGYDIENVPAEDRDKLIKQLAILNLERNQCIDQIDRQFAHSLDSKAGA